MKLHTLSYLSPTGWSAPSFPAAAPERSLVLVFGSRELPGGGEPLRQIMDAYRGAIVIGCSTAGEIHAGRVHDDSLSVAVAEFGHTQLRAAYAPVTGAGDSFAAGESIARQLAGPGLRGVFVVAEGRDINGSELVRGLNASLPAGVVVTGGLAGDGDRMQETWILVDGAPAARTVSAVGFYGDSIRITHGSKGGWDPFGPERRVTRSRGNVLYELDGRPALQLYKEYLGELSSALPASALLFPLAIRPPEASEQRYVRTILDIDEASSSMTFAGDVPEGGLAQLMRANFDRLVQGASDAALMARANDTGPVLSVAISCVGRRLVLRQRVEEETEAALEIMPAQTAQVGFYSYGEISPYTTGNCELHNQTMTLTTFREV